MKHAPLLLSLLALLSAGCEVATRAADAAPEPDPDGGEGAPDASPDSDAPPPLENAVDVLFVIDNSGTMAEEQAQLASGMATFTSALEAEAGGRPSLHLGVISTDMGAGNSELPGCNGNGDDGALQSNPNGACTPPDDAFIKDVIDGEGNRVINYPDGELVETFSCISQLGTQGCGFEQPLESMRRALSGVNAGFLRDGALLAVVFVTDEDDCSASDTTVFDPDQELQDELGPLTSYRCFEFGVKCEPDERDTVGPRQSCAPRSDSQYLHPVDEYVNFLSALKPADRLVVAGITGPEEPVYVGTSETGDPALEPSCTSNDGEAAPAVRLEAFVDSFSGRNHASSICDSVAGPLGQIAELIAENLP